MNKTLSGTATTASDPVLRVARWLLSATLLVPLMVFPGFFFPFVTVRAVFFRVLVELAVALLLFLLLRREIVVFRGDPVMWSLVAWIVANTLAAVFGVAFVRSVFGDHERMGGVWFWVHLLAYYMALRIAFRAEDWWRFFRSSVAVASVISGYGLVQQWLSPFEFGIGGVGNGSTVGNSGLLAGYLLVNVAFSAMLAIRARHIGRLAYGAIALLLVTAIVFSGNRSSALALVVGAGAASLANVIWSGSLRGRHAVLPGIIFAAAAALPFVTRLPWAGPAVSRIPSLARLSGGVDSTRVIQWHAAVEGIRERPLLGVGPENYQIIWSRYYHPEMYRFLSDTRWDRAHNAYLDAFATAGLLGFLSLLAVWITLMWSTRVAAAKSHAAEGTSQGERRGAEQSVALGFFVAYALYLFFWFFDLNSAMLWIAMAAFVATRATGNRLVELGEQRAKRWQTTMVLGFGAIGLVAVLYVHGFETLRMARTLVRAGNPARPLHETLAAFESVFASPAPVTQHALIMYAGRLRDLYPSFPVIRSDARRAAVFDRAFGLGVKEFERQAAQDPLNERMLVQEARVLILGAYYYRDARLYDAALAKLHRAVALSPRRMNTHLVLGVAYLNTERPRQALQIFQQAYAVYPPFGQTQAYLAEAYSALGREDSAAFWLRSSLAHGYRPDREFIQGVAERLTMAGNPLAAAELTLDYVRGRAGPVFLWNAGAAGPDAGDTELAVVSADLFMAAGDTIRAAMTQTAARALCTRPVPLVSLASAAFRPAALVHMPDCREPWRTANVSR